MSNDHLGWVWPPSLASSESGKVTESGREGGAGETEESDRIICACHRLGGRPEDGKHMIAANLLASHRRKHEAIESAAGPMRHACPGGRDPTATDDANDVLPDLQWLACEELGRVAEHVEGVPVPEVSMRESAQ